MLGIDPIIAKSLDVLDRWYTGRKERHELARKLMKEYKLALSNLTHHMAISHKDGYLSPRVYRGHFERDMEELRRFVIIYGDDLEEELRATVNEFINYLEKTYPLLNAGNKDTDSELNMRLTEITRYVEQTVNKIDALLSSN